MVLPALCLPLQDTWKAPTRHTSCTTLSSPNRLYTYIYLHSLTASYVCTHTQVWHSSTLACECTIPVLIHARCSYEKLLYCFETHNKVNFSLCMLHNYLSSTVSQRMDASKCGTCEVAMLLRGCGRAGGWLEPWRGVGPRTMYSWLLLLLCVCHFGTSEHSSTSHVACSSLNTHYIHPQLTWEHTIPVSCTSCSYLVWYVWGKWCVMLLP